jgi:Flp pilus assembly pilin Flp
MSCDLEYAVVSAMVARAVTLVLLAVHHGTLSVFSSISTRLGM